MRRYYRKKPDPDLAIRIKNFASTRIKNIPATKVKHPSIWSKKWLK